MNVEALEDLDFVELTPVDTLEGVVLTAKNMAAVCEWVNGVNRGDHLLIRGCGAPFYKTQKAYPGDMVVVDPRRSEVFVMAVHLAKELYVFGK